MLCWFLPYMILSLPPLLPSLPSRSSQSPWLGSLCYIANFHQLYILHVVVYICQCFFLHSPHFFLPPLCPQIRSLYLHRIAFKQQFIISCLGCFALVNYKANVIGRLDCLVIFLRHTLQVSYINTYTHTHTFIHVLPNAHPCF